MSFHVHHVRGRIRIHVPELKGCEPKAASLSSAIAATPGVTRVECRTVTGSVIVHYQSGSTDLEGLLRLLGCPGSVPAIDTAGTVNRQPRQQATAMPKRDNELAAKVMRAILWFALEKAAERALPALLAAVL
jgi:Heavy metal associated domain 2